jgi:emp24/gp25L/p24 family/GOLD
MDYLRTREQKLRDTNESTNTRVKWFATGTMFLLIALGVWQVIYLRTYFRYAPILTLMRTITDSRLDLSILFRRDAFSLLYFYETLLCVRGFGWRRWSIAGLVGKSCAFERVRCLQCVMGTSRIVDTLKIVMFSRPMIAFLEY